MVSSSVGVLKEIPCKRGIIVGFGEEVGWKVVSFMSERGVVLEES